MTLNMMFPAPTGTVYVCEREVWDGGEWVYCHGQAVERDRDGMWLCQECAPKR